MDRAHRHLRTIAEHVSDFAILGLDVEGRVESWNVGAERLFGYSVEEIVGKHFKVLFTPEDRAAGAPKWEMSQAAETGLARDERWHLRKDGSRLFVHGLLVCVREASGALAGFTKVAQDETDRRMAEEALKESEARYRQLSEELEKRVEERTKHLEQSAQTWESFCYSIAHDLRAPLRTISGFADALLDEYGSALDVTGRDYAARMIAAAHRLDAFIQDLLDFGRLAHVDLPLRKVDLARAIDHVLTELAPSIASTRAQVQLLSPFPVVWANPAALNQAITNLLSNSLKFVPPGAAPRIEIQAEAKGSNVRLWIRDYGIGVSPEHQERIFQLFERLHPQSDYPGTGVGLAIVRKAMERMGGAAGMKSVPGEGACFWIDLPAESRAP